MGRKPLVAVLVVLALVGLVAPAAVADPSPVAVPTAVENHPIGAFDHVSARFGNPSPLAPNPWVEVLSGWAADPDAPGASIFVHLWVDGHPFGPALAADPRPDIAIAYPWAGAHTGWHITVSARDLGPGPHLVCAYAIAVVPNRPNPLLGCQGVPASGPSPFNPVGHLDAATASPGLVRITGWAGDPDGTPTTQLRVVYDNAPEPAVQLVAKLARPDVPVVFPGMSPTTGFDESLPIRPGVHSVCVEVENSGLAGLQNETVGCAFVTVPDAAAPGPHDPVGALDGIGVSPTNCIGVSSCGWNATGWSFDPDTGGPVEVRVRTLTAEPFLATPYRRVVLVVSTGVARPDVQAAHPPAGANAGYDDLVVTTNHGSPTLVCAYALNTGPGANRFIGCH